MCGAKKNMSCLDILCLNGWKSTFAEKEIHPQELGGSDECLTQKSVAKIGIRGSDEI